METHKRDCEHGKRQREIELKAAEELERKKQQEGEDFFAEFVDGLEELEGQYLSLLNNAPKLPSWVCYPEEILSPSDPFCSLYQM